MHQKMQFEIIAFDRSYNEINKRLHHKVIMTINCFNTASTSLKFLMYIIYVVFSL